METAANMAQATDATRRARRSEATSRSEGWPLVGATLTGTDLVVDRLQQFDHLTLLLLKAPDRLWGGVLLYGFKLRAENLDLSQRLGDLLLEEGDPFLVGVGGLQLGRNDRVLGVELGLGVLRPQHADEVEQGGNPADDDEDSPPINIGGVHRISRSGRG